MPIARDENGETRRALDGRALYICDNCEKTEPWNDNWAWFGSYRQMEDYGLEGVAPINTMCSADCRIAMVATSRLPAEELDDAGNVIEDRPQRRQYAR